MHDRPVALRRVVGVVLFAAALAASILGRAPTGGLPEVALGWPLLLHVERAAAAVGISGVALLVIWRAGRGEYPVRFAHIEYEVRSVATELDKGLAAMEERAMQVEGEMERLEARVADIERGD